MASSRHHHATSTSGTDAALLVFGSLSLFLSRLHRSLSSTTLSAQQAAPTAAGNAARSPARGRREVNVGQPTPKESTMRRSEEHTSELQSRLHLVCRLLLEKKKKKYITQP